MAQGVSRDTPDPNPHQDHLPTTLSTPRLPMPAHVVHQQQHLHLCQAAPQALAHPKTKGHMLEGSTWASVQPALGVIALRPREHCRVATQ